MIKQAFCIVSWLGEATYCVTNPSIMQLHDARLIITYEDEIFSVWKDREGHSGPLVPTDVALFISRAVTRAKTNALT